MFDVREVVLLIDLGKMDLNELENASAIARTAIRAAVALRETENGEAVLADCVCFFCDIKWAFNGKNRGIYTVCLASSRCFEA
jgi:hypothetical protein